MRENIHRCSLVRILSPVGERGYPKDNNPPGGHLCVLSSMVIVRNDALPGLTRATELGRIL